jgi:signal peptidase II
VSSGHAVSAAPSRPVPRWLAPSIVVGAVVLDQLTKSWVVAALSDEPLSIIGTDVEFRLTRNSGGAFSLFTNATVILALLASVLSIFLVRAVHRARDRLTVVALSLVLGGALGNLADRMFRSPGVLRGEVVDFVRVGSFPSFNVADSCVTIGAILLIIAAFRAPPEPPPETRTEPPPEHLA